ncbi:MATE family efflux transporter [Methylobacterium nonmethylotrophicum]|uniref:Uncharacterized protein n=1 Tax=Methylobacterium nonmethylotrophicum TaxID=1141884 RepID=A0A4Z0NVY2_9HYPH|nr:MATE family efflux transporter [Methylobacterium nonmethylotrophicum]TGE01250.1 hypothetical protein EU555_06540 [Methylobacterium nonmethylotrophicum]
MAGVALAARPGAAPSGPPGSGLLPLLRVALPLVVSRAGLAAMIVTNGWMVARHDVREVALASLAAGTFGRLTEVFGAAILSALPLVAAASDRGGARRGYWRRANLLALGLGIAGLAAAAGAGPVLQAAVDRPDLAEGAAAVVRAMALGLPAALAALASAMYLEGIGRSGVVAAWILAANALNLLLNWLLIGGHAGFPAWGAYGSALATTLVRVALAAILLAAVLRVDGREPPGAGRDRAGAGAQWRLALGTGGTIAAFHASAVWLILFAGWLGPLALASFASCWVLTMPAMLLAIGIGDAVGLRAAAEPCGSGRLRRDLAWLSAVLLPFSLALWAAPEGVASLYTPEPALRTVIAGLLPVGGTVLLLDGLSYGVGAALRARGDVAGSTAVQLPVLAVTPLLAAAFAFPAGMGLNGVMLAILATSALRLVLLAARLRRTERVGPAPGAAAMRAGPVPAGGGAR